MHLKTKVVGHIDGCTPDGRHALYTVHFNGSAADLPLGYSRGIVSSEVLEKAGLSKAAIRRGDIVVTDVSDHPNARGVFTVRGIEVPGHHHS